MEISRTWGQSGRVIIERLRKSPQVFGPLETTDMGPVEYVMRRYVIRKRELTKLRHAAEKADIFEMCYAVFGRGNRISRLIRVPNRAPDPLMHHVIEACDVARARLRTSALGLHLLGLLHTHILSEPKPGPGDIRGYAPGSLVFIYSDLSDELRAFRMTGRGRGYIECKMEIENR